MANYTAVLIDTTSIQQYVFASAKLKENLGASYLISTIYDEPKTKCDEEGYDGGGKALLFFNDEKVAEAFIRDWTKELLWKTPGLSTAFAIGEIDNGKLDDKDTFKKFKNELFDKLEENKSRYEPQIIIPSHGITEDCPRTGLTAEIWFDDVDKEDSNYISSVSKTKLDASEKAKDKFHEDYKNELDGREFPDNFKELGSTKGEDSHIAIVHIDGNGMGDRFKNCKTLTEIQNLSKKVEEATENSFRELLKNIKSDLDSIDGEINLKNQYFPIRPIILGGDDITFVCDGRMGLYFAKTYLENFEKKKASDDKNLSACAGIAITKLKYPFYRGYLLAEQLCQKAKKIRLDEGKKKRLDENDYGSWIDFHISHGGFSGTIEEIREKKYMSLQGSMLMRPYKIGEADDEYSFDVLIGNTKKLIEEEDGKRKFPNSKLKELREVLTYGEEISRSFVAELEARGIELPKIKTYDFEKSLYAETSKKVETNKKKRTPYFDMIELSELYPKFLLK